MAKKIHTTTKQREIKDTSVIQAQALFQQALAHHRKGELTQAEMSYEAVLNLQPRHFDTLHLLGVIALQTKKHQLAAELMAKAIEVNPNFASAYSNRGMALRELNRLDEAVASYDQAIALKPDYADAYYNRGNALKGLRRLDDALASYDRALALRPDDAEAYFNRGHALQELKRLDDALASYDRAIALNPDYAEAYNNRGIALQELKRLDDALASYEKALALKPDFEFLSGTLLHCKMKLCNWHGLAENLTNLETDIRFLKKTTPPLAALALLDLPELHKQVAEIYAETTHPKMERLGSIEKRARHDRIRVGYFSADFHNHAVSYLMAELFEVHDPARFELFGFSFGPDVQDEMRTRVSAAFDTFIDVRDKSDLEVAGYARELGIDIAVNLSGFTGDSRPGIFAQRSAPIQVSYLGYPGTMGTEYMDYIVADKIVIPTERQSDYTEKVVYLPHSFLVNDSTRKVSERVFTRQEFGLPDSGFVYCCFNNSYKILPSTFDCWMRILKAVKGSVLWLRVDNPTAAQNLRQEAETRGVEPGRLLFAHSIPMDEHLARQRVADLFLDTLPYNAHTTASDALWAGLPVLTGMGRSFAGRVAASLLTAIDLPELITQTESEYEALAIALASDPGRVAQIKHKLELNRRTSPLFNTKQFTRDLESAYEAMYERYQADLPLESIEIKDETVIMPCP